MSWHNVSGQQQLTGQLAELSICIPTNLTPSMITVPTGTTTTTGQPRTTTKCYCFLHGTDRKHNGTQCRGMGPTSGYTDAQRKAKGPGLIDGKHGANWWGGVEGTSVEISWHNIVTETPQSISTLTKTLKQPLADSGATDSIFRASDAHLLTHITPRHSSGNIPRRHCCNIYWSRRLQRQHKLTTHPSRDLRRFRPTTIISGYRRIHQ